MLPASADGWDGPASLASSRSAPSHAVSLLLVNGIPLRRSREATGDAAHVPGRLAGREHSAALLRPMRALLSYRCDRDARAWRARPPSMPPFPAQLGRVMLTTGAGAAAGQELSF